MVRINCFPSGCLAVKEALVVLPAPQGGAQPVVESIGRFTTRIFSATDRAQACSFDSAGTRLSRHRLHRDVDSRRQIRGRSRVRLEFRKEGIRREEADRRMNADPTPFVLVSRGTSISILARIMNGGKTGSTSRIVPHGKNL